MILRICSFSKTGKELGQSLIEKWDDVIAIVREDGESLSEFVEKGFSMRQAILFIGACGIAVRSIAPYVKDKLTDSPVVVMDEKGEYVIPILSGHVGGANELARVIGSYMQATPVITTATDVEGVFSVDVFAKKNGLRIGNRKGIQLVSEKLLRGKQITMCISPELEICKDSIPEEIQFVEYPPQAQVDVLISNQIESHMEYLLHLIPQKYVLGIGCKKGKSFEDINNFVEEMLTSQFAGIEDPFIDVCKVASIDLKKKEIGLAAFATYRHMDFVTYTADELNEVVGDFEESEFVKTTTGVSNVCERAAVCCGGEQSELIMKKCARDGVTLAVAKRAPISLQF